MNRVLGTYPVLIADKSAQEKRATQGDSFFLAGYRVGFSNDIIDPGALFVKFIDNLYAP
jgi:hypothetical protein